MHLLPDVSCSEVEPQEIRLHSLHEGENAGSLLGTRMRALFLPHCRRREWTSLRGSGCRWLEHVVFQDSCFEPGFDGAPHRRKGLEFVDECFVIDLVEAIRTICIQYIFGLFANVNENGLDGILG